MFGSTAGGDTWGGFGGLTMTQTTWVPAVAVSAGAFVAVRRAVFGYVPQLAEDVPLTR